MGAVGHSGPLLYFMGHLRGAWGDEGCVMGSFDAGPGQVRTVRRRDLQDGSSAALPPAPPFALLAIMLFSLITWFSDGTAHLIQRLQRVKMDCKVLFGVSPSPPSPSVPIMGR